MKLTWTKIRQITVPPHAQDYMYILVNHEAFPSQHVCAYSLHFHAPVTLLFLPPCTPVTLHPILFPSCQIKLSTLVKVVWGYDFLYPRYRELQTDTDTCTQTHRHTQNTTSIIIHVQVQFYLNTLITHTCYTCICFMGSWQELQTSNNYIVKSKRLYT